MTRTCFWGHLWSKWTEITREYSFVPHAAPDKQFRCTDLLQRRTCLRCGRIQEEMLRDAQR